MKYFRLKNYDRFMHYPDRTPRWVKLYHKILDIENDWYQLNDIQSGQFVRIIALACRTENAMPYNNDVVAGEINATHPVDLEVFLKLGMVQVLPSKAKCLSLERSRQKSRGTATSSASKSASGKLRPLSQSQSQSQSQSLSDQGPTDPLSGNPPNRAARPRKKPAPYEQVIFYLNKRAGTEFKVTTKATRNLIKARWDEGTTLDEFYRVIDRQCGEWLGDGDMRKYLRPATLFNASKFESYLGGLGDSKGLNGLNWKPSGMSDDESA